MTKYVLKRLVYIVVVFIVISVVMFSLFNLIPSDPAREQLESKRKDMTAQEYEFAYTELRNQMGLDDPLAIRYLRWFGLAPEKQSGKFEGILQGYFGYSYGFKQDCIDVMKVPMGNTLMFNIFSVILTLAVTIPLGIVCAVRKNSKMDQAVQSFTILGYSIPSYIIALIFIFLFAVLLRWFPVSGAKTPGSNYTGLKEFMDRLYYMALPIIISAFASLGGMSRYVRASMIDALSMDCVRTARAKGVKERVVIYSHAWRNALLPVITSIIGWFLSVFSGSIVLEQMFGLNGMGKLYINALNTHDNELCLAIQMFYTIIALCGNLITDLAYGLVDPRVRVNK
ncbi:MAG: ABC transporter permease [Oscillospiraceae bacterium]|nr:ABC transporter permease [Oscillospiraceae bacterium]